MIENKPRRALHFIQRFLIHRLSIPWYNTLAKKKVKQTPFQSMHRQHNYLGCQNPGWSQTASPRRKDPNTFTGAINQGQNLARIDPLGSNFVGSSIWDHLECLSSRQVCWRWRDYVWNFLENWNHFHQNNSYQTGPEALSKGKTPNPCLKMIKCLMSHLVCIQDTAQVAKKITWLSYTLYGLPNDFPTSPPSSGTSKTHLSPTCCLESLFISALSGKNIQIQNHTQIAGLS